MPRFEIPPSAIRESETSLKQGSETSREQGSETDPVATEVRLAGYGLVNSGAVSWGVDAVRLERD